MARWRTTAASVLNGVTRRQAAALKRVVQCNSSSSVLDLRCFHDPDSDPLLLQSRRGFSGRTDYYKPPYWEIPSTRYVPVRREILLPDKFIQDHDGRILKTPTWTPFRRFMDLTKAIEGEDGKRLPWTEPLPEGSWQTWKDTMVCFGVSLPNAIQVYALNAMDGMLYHVIDFVSYVANYASFAACNGKLYVIGVAGRKPCGRKLVALGVWVCDITASGGSGTLCWVPGPPLNAEKFCPRNPFNVNQFSPRAVVVNENIYVISCNNHTGEPKKKKEVLFEVLNTNEHHSGTGTWRVLDNPPYQFNDDYPIAHAVVTETSDPVILFYSKYGQVLCFDVNTEKWNTLLKEDPRARCFSLVVSKTEKWDKDRTYGVYEFDAKHGGRCFVFDAKGDVRESTVDGDIFCCPSVYAYYINDYYQASDAGDILPKESDDVELPDKHQVVGLKENALCLLNKFGGIDEESFPGFVFRIGGDNERICMVSFFMYKAYYHDYTSKCAFVCTFDLWDDAGNEILGDARVNLGQRILKVAHQPNCRFHLLNSFGDFEAETYSKMCSSL